MSFPATSLFEPPYGIAFSIEELTMVQDWVKPRRLWLSVALDQALDGVEFEEMLILSQPDRRWRAATIWQTSSSFFAQMPGGVPTPFTTLPGTLSALSLTLPKHSSLFRFWGRRGERGFISHP